MINGKREATPGQTLFELDRPLSDFPNRPPWCDLPIQEQHRFERRARDVLVLAEKLRAAQPALHFARIEGYDFLAMRDAVEKTPLYKMGDCCLVWMNMGDLETMRMAGQAKDCSR